MMMLWATKYISKRYPDCWEFVREVYDTELGIDLPTMTNVFPDLRKIIKAIESHPHKTEWTKIDEPHELCGVAMAQANHMHHVGIWTEADNGKVVHTLDNAPVVAQSLLQLERHGFKRIEFYEFGDVTDSK